MSYSILNISDEKVTVTFDRVHQKTVKGNDKLVNVYMGRETRDDGTCYWMTASLVRGFVDSETLAKMRAGEEKNKAILSGQVAAFVAAGVPESRARQILMGNLKVPEIPAGE